MDQRQTLSTVCRGTAVPVLLWSTNARCLEPLACRIPVLTSSPAVQSSCAAPPAHQRDGALGWCDRACVRAMCESHPRSCLIGHGGHDKFRGRPAPIGVLSPKWHPSVVPSPQEQAGTQRALRARGEIIEGTIAEPGASSLGVQLTRPKPVRPRSGAPAPVSPRAR